MSQETLDIAQRAMRAALARPTPDYETVNRLYAPDHVFAPAGAPSGVEEEARGAAGFDAWRESLSELLGEPEHDLRGAVDVGPEKVLAVVNTRFRGRTSGLQGEQRLWSVVTVRRGRVVRTEAYTDPLAALDAARKP